MTALVTTLRWYLRGLRFMPRMLAAIFGGMTVEEVDALEAEVRAYRETRP